MLAVLPTIRPGVTKNRTILCALAWLLALHAWAQATPEEAFDRAMAQRERGELSEAIRGFHALLAQHPGLNRARLELAVAYYQTLDHRAALEHARRVLADPATPPTVRENVQRLIGEIEADARPHSFSASVSAGLLYDSNVSAGPASPSYEIGATLVSLDAGAVKRSDSAATLSLGASHRYLTGFRPRLGAREGALLWLSQAGLHAVDYFDENPYDLRVLTVSSGPAWIAPPRLRLSAPLQFDRLDLGDAHYLDIFAWSPALSFPLDGVELQLDGQLQSRNYRRAVDAGRDSDYRGAGAQVGRVLSWLSFQAGLRYYRDDAEAGAFDSRGEELFAAAARQLGRASAYARLTFQRTRYDEPDPLAAAARRDRERRLSLGVSYGWASLSFLHARRRSSLDFYEFDRRQVALSATRSF
jgi:hypothetical protein